MLHHPLRRVADDPLAFLETLAASAHEGLATCRIGGRPAVLVTSPALVEEVLVRRADRFVKGRGYLRASRLVGGGLLTASGPAHAAHRRLLAPVFHHARLAAWGATMTAHAAAAGERWAPGGLVDVTVEMQALTLGIAGAALFGADLASRAADVRRAVAEAVSPLDGLRSVVAGPRRLQPARAALDDLVGEIIAARQRRAEGRDDLLDVLLAHAGSDVTRVRDEVVTFLLAGHDTLAHALTWTWVLLAAHPAAGDGLRAELDAVLAGRVPTVGDLDALPMTRAVLAEALRLRPPAWVIVREAVADERLGDVVVPARGLVLVSPWVLHRDPRHFPDPLRFDPGRWLAPPEDRPRLAWLPFGAGMRSCIGESFAWMEGMLVLATLAARWRLEGPEAAVEPLPRMTLRPAGPVLMRPVPIGGSR